MRKLFTIFALTVTLVGTSYAATDTDATREASAPTTVGGTSAAYQCGQRWKAHKASASYSDPGKGARVAAWNDYRKSSCQDLAKKGGKRR